MISRILMYVRRDPLSGLTCRLFEGKRHMKRMIVEKWAYLPRRCHPCIDLYQIWHSGSFRGPDHPWYFLAIGL